MFNKAYQLVKLNVSSSIIIYFLQKLNQYIFIANDIAMLQRWFVEDKGETNSFVWDQNEPVVEWLEEQKKDELSIVNRNINAVRKDAIVSQIKKALEVSS